jgi:hypothetical protein
MVPTTLGQIAVGVTVDIALDTARHHELIAMMAFGMLNE